MASACPSTNVRPSAAHTSASQYHVNMHSAATTRSSRYGATVSATEFGYLVLGEERVRRRFDVAVQQHLAGGVEDADVHGLHVEIDSAIVPMLSVVESHSVLLLRGMRTCPALKPTVSRWQEEG